MNSNKYVSKNDARVCECFLNCFLTDKENLLSMEKKKKNEFLRNIFITLELAVEVLEKCVVTYQIC